MYPTVDTVVEFHARGPWKTKSGGELSVAFALPIEIIMSHYFNYVANELARVPEDIRGLRMYISRGFKKGSIGGTEFHRVREEFVFGLEGRLRWWCDDVYGNRKEWILKPGFGLWMHPYILHSYEVLEENSGLIVIANTLFNPENPATHDTYSQEEFSELRLSLTRCAEEKL